MVGPDNAIDKVEEIKYESPEVVYQVSIPLIPIAYGLVNDKFKEHFEVTYVVDCDSLCKQNT